MEWILNSCLVICFLIAINIHRILRPVPIGRAIKDGVVFYYHSPSSSSLGGERLIAMTILTIVLSFYPTLLKTLKGKPLGEDVGMLHFAIFLLLFFSSVSLFTINYLTVMIINKSIFIFEHGLFFRMRRSEYDLAQCVWKQEYKRATTCFVLYQGDRQIAQTPNVSKSRDVPILVKIVQATGIPLTGAT